MAKRKRLKKGVKKVLITLLLFATLATGAYLLYDKTDFFKNISSPLDNLTGTKDDTPKEVWPKVYKASMIATGDGLLHNPLYIDAYDNATGTFDFKPHLTMIKDIVSKYDIAYYNQETTFGGKENTPKPDKYGFSSYPTFNSPSEYGDAMIDAGFNMVSLASNHSVDCLSNAKKCILNSYEYWQSKDDIVFAGFNPTEENTNNYIISEKNGITYTLLNYSTSLNGLDNSIKNDQYLVNRWDEEKVKQDILEVRDKVDVLIVAMHWHTGAEYTFTPTEENKQIAKFLADNGVDIILGTYSHCLQPFDIIDDTIVYYSLGNFISNQNDPELMIPYYGYKGAIGVLASLDITKTVNEDGTKEIKIDNLGADLTYTYAKNRRNYKVVPFSKMNSDYNPKYQELYEEYSQILTTYNNNINIAPLGA